MVAHPLWAQKEIPIGLQLSTLTRMAKADLPGTLRQIHEAGYQEIELTPVAYTLPVDQLRKVVADSGLTAPSGHFEYTDPPGQWGLCQSFRHQVGGLPHAAQVAVDFRRGLSHRSPAVQSVGRARPRPGDGLCLFTIMIMNFASSMERPVSTSW